MAVLAAAYCGSRALKLETRSEYGVRIARLRHALQCVDAVNMQGAGYNTQYAASSLACCLSFYSEIGKNDFLFRG
ncbi:hypothetical protein BK133_06330 [Paenibacillus sp. FSL H8-0548]|nr:hypothetical protein BK133_06330 [Paenibacillus sp. FSL H8-0548]